MGDVRPPVDHLVYAVPDLDAGVRRIEALLGAPTSPGGRHEGVGTWNRLLGLGPGVYLEIVSRDPDRPTPSRSRWFGLDDLHEPRLATWCAKADDLSGIVERARGAGLELGPPTSGSRVKSDGSTLAWTVTDPWADRAGGVIPFFIDWSGSAHPSADLPHACTLLGLRVEHPDAARVAGWMDALGLDTEVVEGHAARVIATIESPNGVVELS